MIRSANEKPGKAILQKWVVAKANCPVWLKLIFHFIDELLEDLQSTVTPRPTVNGNTSGYRQTYKTFTTQKSGHPPETSKECEIEYLNPSNTTSVITERSKSPFFDKVRNLRNSCDHLRLSDFNSRFMYTNISSIATGKFDQW